MSSKVPTPPSFTPREKEVLVALCEGATYGAIARRLAISPHTVDAHIRRIKAKAGVGSRAELVVLAVLLEVFGGDGARAR